MTTTQTERLMALADAYAKAYYFDVGGDKSVLKREALLAALQARNQQGPIKTWQERLEETCPALGPMHIHACVEEVNDAMQAEIAELRTALQAREGVAVAPLPERRPRVSLGEAVRDLITAADAADKTIVDQSEDLQKLRLQVTRFREHLDFTGDPATLPSAYATPPQPASQEPVAPKLWHQRIKEAHPRTEPEYWPSSLKAQYMEEELLDLRALRERREVMKASTPPSAVPVVDDALARATSLNEMSLASIQGLQAVSDEYNEWIRFHAGGGDYDDFLKIVIKRNLETEPAIAAGQKFIKENGK